MALRPTPSLWALALLTACVSPPARPAPLPVCAATVPAASGWATVQGASYRIDLPPPVRKRVISGIDGTVNRFTAGGLVVSIEEGPYAGGLTRDSAERAACDAVLGGKAARVTSYWDDRERSYVVHAFWRGIGPPLALGVPGLSVDVRTRNATLRTSMLTVVRSVRFVER